MTLKPQRDDATGRDGLPDRAWRLVQRIAVGPKVAEATRRNSYPACVRGVGYRPRSHTSVSANSFDRCQTRRYAYYQGSVTERSFRYPSPVLQVLLTDSALFVLVRTICVTRSSNRSYRAFHMHLAELRLRVVDQPFSSRRRRWKRIMLHWIRRCLHLTVRLAWYVSEGPSSACLTPPTR